MHNFIPRIISKKLMDRLKCLLCFSSFRTSLERANSIRNYQEAQSSGVLHSRKIKKDYLSFDLDIFNFWFGREADILFVLKKEGRSGTKHLHSSY